jgi:Uma2 family endonuclease
MQQTTAEIQSAEVSLLREASEISQKDEGVKKHLWNQKEYYQMAELGFFHGKRVELIEGEIIEMSPMNKAHATSVRKTLDCLRLVFKENYLIDSQLPVSFSKITEPEPDIAVIEGKIEDFVNSHPKTAALIIEISDATLSYDRNRKASLYAKNKIQDYWVVNLKDRRLEVYRRPIKDKNSFYGFGYAERLIFTDKETASPLAAPDAKIKVADLLP